MGYVFSHLSVDYSNDAKPPFVSLTNVVFCTTKYKKAKVKQGYTFRGGSIPVSGEPLLSSF